MPESMSFEQIYQSVGFGSMYGRAIDELVALFRRIRFAPVTMTREERTIGIDALPLGVRLRVHEIAEDWERKNDYELSSNQLAGAFFAMARERRLVIVEDAA